MALGYTVPGGRAGIGAWYGPPPMVSWSTAEWIPPGWSGPTHVTPSSSVYEILTVFGLSSVSSAAHTRLWKPRGSVKPRSVKPMGSESITVDDGAERLTQLADSP